MIAYLDRVAVRERQDGGISITRFAVSDMQKYGYESEDDFIAWYMNRIAPGEPFSVISGNDIPKDVNGKWDKKDRSFWSFKNGKVEIDSSKLQKKQAKQARKESVLAKLKISDEEFKELIST